MSTPYSEDIERIRTLMTMGGRSAIADVAKRAAPLSAAAASDANPNVFMAVNFMIIVWYCILVRF